MAGEQAPNQESRLTGDPEERMDIDEVLPDGLTDESNVRDYAEDELNLEGVQRMTDVESPVPGLGSVVDAVVELLEAKDEESPSDIYVWSDGSVTDSETPPNDETYMVSLFSPTDDPLDREEILESLERGFAEVPPGHAMPS